MIAVHPSLRTAVEGDYDFMRLLYHASRAEEMQHFPFGEAEKTQFLDWQFRCQWDHYQKHYPTCDWRIIEIDGSAVGRLLIDRWPDQIRVVDIALMPEARAHGIGSRLMHSIMDEARAAGKPVTIHVETFNPAQRLYRRLGFIEVDSSGAYLLMRWTPDQVKTAS